MIAPSGRATASRKRFEAPQRPVVASRPMRLLRLGCFVLLTSLAPATDALAASVPVRARRVMVSSQNAIASQVGVEALMAGGDAVDGAIATAFALAVVHPEAGNVGGGGFLLLRTGDGESAAYDFREQAPAAASPTMFLADGRYDPGRHHQSALAVGVPGTVAGLYQAWRDFGRLPWKDLLRPAIALAHDGFEVSDALARSLRGALPRLSRYPSSLAQFSHAGAPYEAGERLRQEDLAKTLARIAESGPDGFYAGETAALIEREMQAQGGLVTREDLKRYAAHRRSALRGSYRGYELLTVPPPSAGGSCLLESLNVLEGFDLGAMGFGSARYVHHVAEALRRAFADRARYLGDPDFVKDMPIERLISKEYAATLRRSIQDQRASPSSPSSFEWPAEGRDTTQLSVVDEKGGAVALTFTLESSYGSGIVVSGAGFLLNNEMGDFNAAPGLTDESGLIGSAPNLAAPGKRMLSNMTPTILVKDARPALVVGAAGGRKIPGTVLQIVLDVVDFGMNVQEAIDAPRVDHQWLPDVIIHERFGLSPDTLALLRAWGHRVEERPASDWSRAHGVAWRDGMLEGGVDRRKPDGGAIGR
jgi:gamma-glutamyltranspeptidase/glutathione hydrolase